MSDLLSIPTRDDIRRWFETGEMSLWQLAARLLFLGVLGLLVILAATVNFVFAAAIAALLAGQMLRIIFPTERFRTLMRSYWTGEAGLRWRRRWYRLVDGVRGVGARILRGSRRLWGWATPW